VTSVALESAGRRLAGEQQPRGRSLVTAGVAGVATAVLVYKLLRSGAPE
jgi:hypothetical protein